MDTNGSSSAVERQDPRETIDFEKIEKSLKAFYAVQRENEDLNDLVRRLTEQVAIERGKGERLERSYQEVRDERDFYMRSTVELRTQLSNVATQLNELAGTLTKNAEQARMSATFVRPEARPRTAETIERNDMPRIVQQGPAFGEPLPHRDLRGKSA